MADEAVKKLERKYLAHYLNPAFTTSDDATYVRLGKDLEEFSVELNPEVETVRNILGENSVQMSGYEVSADTDPFYYAENDALAQKILDIALGRLTGESCKTTYVDVILKPGETGAAPTVVTAWREEVYVVPTSYGGDTTGVQTPFTVHFAGNRVEGTFDLETKKFTPKGSAL